MDVSSVLFIMEGNLIKVASQNVAQEKKYCKISFSYWFSCQVREHSHLAYGR